MKLLKHYIEHVKFTLKLSKKQRKKNSFLKNLLKADWRKRLKIWNFKLLSKNCALKDETFKLNRIHELNFMYSTIIAWVY